MKPAGSNQHPGAAAAPWLPVEVVLLGYLAVVSVVAAVRIPARPVSRWVIAANVMIAILIFLIRNTAATPGLRQLRELYPLLLVLVLYSELDLLNGVGMTVVHDGIVHRWEATLFGGQVSRDWWQARPSWVWSTVFHGAYLAFYPIVVVPAVWFVARQQFPAARRAVLWVMTSFVLCYLAFIFFPVAGPYYEFPRPSGAFVDNPMARLVYATLAQGSSYGAAFPSSHVAAAAASTAAAFSGSRRLGFMLLGPTVLLVVGVVYCQMHYAIDAVAGLLIAVLVVVASSRLNLVDPYTKRTLRSKASEGAGGNERPVSGAYLTER